MKKKRHIHFKKVKVTGRHKDDNPIIYVPLKWHMAGEDFLPMLRLQRKVPWAFLGFMCYSADERPCGTLHWERESARVHCRELLQAKKGKHTEKSYKPLDPPYPIEYKGELFTLQRYDGKAWLSFSSNSRNRWAKANPGNRKFIYIDAPATVN